MMIAAAGCSTSNHYLGSSATLAPGWGSLKQAAIQGITDPNVWIPAAAAVALQINDLDQQASDYLSEETPIFGDAENAGEWSDTFKGYTSIAYASAAIAAPGPDNVPEWIGLKALTIGSQWASVQVVYELTGEIKQYTDRTRPDGSNDLSLPSRHATEAAYQAQLAEMNIKHLQIDDEWKRGLNITVNSFAALAGYARIEAGRHYPSDVLIGWSLGNFFGYIAAEFLDANHATIMPAVSSDSTGVLVSVNF